MWLMSWCFRETTQQLSGGRKVFSEVIFFTYLLLFGRSVMSDPMDCSTPGFPVLHHLPGFAQTHVHWVDDATQPSHHLIIVAPSPPAFKLSQNQDHYLEFWNNRKIAFLNDWYMAPLSMEFSRQEYWSGLPFPSPMHESGKWKWSRSVLSNS